jgi:alkanesulfonate monooxygenase SsuD/methylene tetrahydromethanopterin reductase-like flavin-dependent oxidoreductase (luciferase family)
VDRTWYGGARLRSTCWAARQGLNLLTGNVLTDGEGGDDFNTIQLTLIKEYRRLVSDTRPGRVALGRVVVPFDSADAKTRTRYRDYAASRYERTLKPQGEAGTLFAPDVVGTADQILEQLSADPVVAAVSELRLELPYEFHREDYEQILHDFRHLIAPEIGWRPSAPVPADPSGLPLHIEA